MKMWVVKTFHFLEPVRKLDRYRRLIIASLMSAVLVISIIFVGSFLLTARSGSSDGYSYFETINGMVNMTRMCMHGPVMYYGLQVTNVTADWANITGMLLVRHLPDGRNLTMRVENAIAKKLVIYTTLISWSPHGPSQTFHGNDTVPPYFEKGIDNIILFDVYMKAVYLHAESLSTSCLNLTFV